MKLWRNAVKRARYSLDAAAMPPAALRSSLSIAKTLDAIPRA